MDHKLGFPQIYIDFTNQRHVTVQLVPIIIETDQKWSQFI